MSEKQQNELISALKSDNKLTEKEWTDNKEQRKQIIDSLSGKKKTKLQEKYNTLDEIFAEQGEQIINNTSSLINEFKSIFEKEKISLNTLKNRFEKHIYQKILQGGFSNKITSELIIQLDSLMEKEFKSFDTGKDGKLNKNERKELVRFLEIKIGKIIFEAIDIKKMNEILLSVIENNFNIEVSLDFGYKDRVYQSLDNYNPEIDTTVDHSEDLKKIVQYYRDKGSELKHLGKPLNQSDGKLENHTKENIALQKIIKDFYKNNKHIIDDKLGITNINNLTPAQATKLVSFITMSNLEYNNAQAIYPGNEKVYYHKLSDINKLKYKKDLYISSKMAIFSQFSPYINSFSINGEITFNTIKKLSKNLYKNIEKEIIESDFKPLNIGNIENKAYEDGLDELNTRHRTNFKFNELNLNGLPKLTKNIYLANSNTYKKNSKSDSLSISKMLEEGKGVCRNYAIANEKLFEALKGLQVNKRLTSSILIYYSGNDSGNKVAHSEVNGHAWNTLITIGKDGKKYLSQVDSQLSDTGGKKGGIKQVDTLDRTYERLFNDLADNISGSEFKKIDKKLQNYILSLEKISGNKNKIILMKLKLASLYYNLGENNKSLKIKEDLLTKEGFKKNFSKELINLDLSKDNFNIAIKFKKEIPGLSGNSISYLINDSNWGKISKYNFSKKVIELKKYLKLGFSGKDTIFLIYYGFNLTGEGGKANNKLIKNNINKYSVGKINDFIEILNTKKNN